MSEQLNFTQNTLEAVNPLMLDQDREARLQASFNSYLPDSELDSIRRQVKELPFMPVSSEQVAVGTEVLIDGTYKGSEIGLPEANRNGYDELDEREWFTGVVKRNPDVAATLAEKRVAGFHATGSFALANVIESGILSSGRHLTENDKPSISGAHDAHINGQSTISFGTLARTEQNINNYGGKKAERTNEQVITDMQAQIKEAQAVALEATEANNPELHTIYAKAAYNLQKALDGFVQDPRALSSVLMKVQFPVAFGVSRDFVRETEEVRDEGRLLQGQSYDGEFRPAATVIPLEAMPVIAVPSERVAAVTELLQMFNHEHTSVVPLEALAA